MTVSQVLAYVDDVKPNQYDDDIKIKWLSALEGRIFNDVINTHMRNYDELIEDTEEETYSYTEFGGLDSWDMETQLVVPDEYAELYSLYIMAKIDFSNGETDRYQNSSLMFNASYNDFTAWYNRTHKPISRSLKIF